MSHLPSDVWFLIAASLTAEDILTFPLVCQAFYALAQERSFWINFLECHRYTIPLACSIYAEFWKLELSQLRHLVSHHVRLKRNLATPNPLYKSMKSVKLCRAWNILITVPGTDFIVLRSQDDGSISCWNISTEQQQCSIAVEGTRPASLAYVTSCKYEEPGKCHVAIIFIDDEHPGQDLLIVLCLDYGSTPSLHVILRHQYDSLLGFLSVAIGPDLIAYTMPSANSYNEITRRKISTGETRSAILRISQEVEVRTQMFLQGQDLYLCCHSADGVRLYCWPDADSDWHLVGRPWYFDDELTLDTIAAMDVFTCPPTKSLVTLRPYASRQQQFLLWHIPSIQSITDPDNFVPSPDHNLWLEWETHFNESSLVIATSDLSMFLLIVEERIADTDDYLLSLRLVKFLFEPNFSTSIHTLQIPPEINLRTISDLSIDERKGMILLMSSEGLIFQISYA